MALLPGFRLQVLTYAGNGSNPRTIATTFPLNTGVVAALAQGLTSPDVFHRSTAYPANSSSIAGSTTLSTVGLLAFLSGGVQVGSGLNQIGETYTLLVMQDTDDGRHLSVGTYTGTGSPRTVTGVGFKPNELSIWGSGVHYRSDQFLGNSSLQLSKSGSAEVTNEITGFVDDGFTLGSDPGNDINVAAATRYWLALRTAHLGGGYQSFKVVGTAAADDATGNLGFTPEWVVAGRHQATTTQGALFKGPAHTGTQSTEWHGSGGITASGGINAITGETVRLGALLTPTGVASYGFAVKSFTYPADWILLNDAPESAKVRRENSAIAIHDVLNDAPNTASLTVQGQPGGPGPQGGSALDVYDPATATKLFRGSLQTIEQFYDEKPTQLGWHVTAIDATWRLNKYRPFGVYEDVSATTVVLDLIETYAPGFTGDHVQTNLAAISVTLDGSQTFSEVLTAICQAIGSGHWYVDYENDVHLFRVVSATVALSLPPAPATAVTLSVGASAASITPVYWLAWVAYRYADGTLSDLSPSSNVLWHDGTHTLQVDTIPVGTPDATHGAVVARVLFSQVLNNNYAGLKTLVNPDPPATLFTLNDNTTASVQYAFVNQTTPPVLVGYVALAAAFPPVVNPLPAGPVTAPTATLDSADSASLEGWDAGTVDPMMEFAVTGVYDNGIETLLGSWSTPIEMNVGGVYKKVNFSSVPTVADYAGHVARYRKIYARLAWSAPAYGKTFSDVYRGWMIVPNNTATVFNDDGRYNNPIFAGFYPTPLPASPHVDGPDPEAGDAPDDIDDTTTTLLVDPPITLSEDHSQIRTRVYGHGGGTTAIGSILGAISLRVSDITLFDRAGGQVIVGTAVLGYTGINVDYLLLADPLPAAIPFGTVVSLWVQRDDLVAQGELGAIELDEYGEPTDGVHEFVVVDTSLRSVAALNARCDAELALFSRPISTVRYATRDPNTRSGKRVAITLTTPPISGSFVIQDVTIDQIQFNATLVARYTVTASSVRFTLDDLLQRVILSGTSGPGTGSSASSSGGSGGGSGGGGGTVVNSGTLDDNHLILGDSGTRISALADLGTSTKVLHGNASGAPTFSAVNLAADVTGLLPAASVDFTGVTLGLTRAQVLAEAFLR